MVDWDLEFRLSSTEIGNRISRISTLSSNQALRSELTRDLLDQAENNVNTTVVGLVHLLTQTIGVYYVQLPPKGRVSFSMLLPILLRQIAEVLIDDASVRGHVTQGLYESFDLTNEE